MLKLSLVCATQIQSDLPEATEKKCQSPKHHPRHFTSYSTMSQLQVQLNLVTKYIKNLTLQNFWRRNRKNTLPSEFRRLQSLHFCKTFAVPLFLGISNFSCKFQRFHNMKSAKKHNKFIKVSHLSRNRRSKWSIFQQASHQDRSDISGVRFH